MDTKEKFSLKYLFFGDTTNPAKDWFKALGMGWRLVVIAILLLILVAGFLQLKNFLFPKPSQNVNRPTAVALPFSRVDKIDQTSTQVLVEEKSWEVGVGAAGLNYDNKSGSVIGIWVKKKW